MPTLAISIQYCTQSVIQNNKTTKGNQVDTNWKRSQSIMICRQYDSIHKQPQKFYQRTPVADKQLQQSVWT